MNKKIIEFKISSDADRDVSEFIREAILRVIEEDPLKMSKLNETISIGIEQADRGEFSDRSVQDIIREKEAKTNR